VEPDGGAFTIIPESTLGLSDHTFDPSAAGSGTYTIRWTHSHLGPGHLDQTIIVDSAPKQPSGLISFPDKFCMDLGGNISLTGVGGSGTTQRYYDDFPGGNEIGTGASVYIPAPTLTTTYYVVWDNNNSCNASLGWNYSVIVYPISATDMAIHNIDDSYCNDADDAVVNGNPEFGWLSKTYSLSPSSMGFTDNGDGTGIISPSNMAAGNYSLTYTVNKDNCIQL